MKLVISIVNAYFRSQRRRQLRNIKRRVKVVGERILFSRSDAKAVELYRYLPSAPDKKPMPLVINIHGGAWIRGHALALDSQSQMISDDLGALVLSVNYKKVDQEPFPYAQNEIYSVVRHYIDNADSLGIDKNRVVLIGYSAGAHLAACVAQMLRDDGISLFYQVLCYPFTDFTYGGGSQKEIKDELDKIKLMDKVFFTKIPRDNPLASPGINPSLSGLPKTIITTCGKDTLRIQGEEYARRLREAGIEVTLINDEDAIHGYLECNYPETAEDDSKSPLQEKLCHNMMKAIFEKIKESF